MGRGGGWGGGFEGEAGAQGERQKAQSFYDDFSPKNSGKKELRIRKNLKAAEKSQIKYFNNGCEQKGFAYSSMCVSMCVCLCLCVTIRMSIRVGVNCSAIQKTGKSGDLCFFVLLGFFFFLSL